MKCNLCNTEMLVDRVVERQADSVTEFYYKCPNRQCANFGYREKQTEKGE